MVSRTSLEVRPVKEEGITKIKLIFRGKGLRQLDVFKKSNIVEGDMDWVVSTMGGGG